MAAAERRAWFEARPPASHLTMAMMGESREAPPRGKVLSHTNLAILRCSAQRSLEGRANASWTAA